jgi:DNA polymerase III subunit delta
MPPTGWPPDGAALADWRRAMRRSWSRRAICGEIGAAQAVRGPPAAVPWRFTTNRPTRAEIEDELAAPGLTRIDAPAAMTDLSRWRALDPGDFRQTLEKIALYKWQRRHAPDPAEVAACAPATIEADMDDAARRRRRGAAMRDRPAG